LHSWPAPQQTPLQATTPAAQQSDRLASAQTVPAPQQAEPQTLALAQQVPPRQVPPLQHGRVLSHLLPAGSQQTCCPPDDVQVAPLTQHGLPPQPGAPGGVQQRL
jgi:hypothetical protein